MAIVTWNHLFAVNRWLVVFFTLAVFLFAITQFSNANTHLAQLQKVGNHLDDSRLTNAVRPADSLAEARENIKFAYFHVLPAYYLHEFFEIETQGRRVMAAAILVLSFIYLLFLLVHYRILDKYGLLAFALLFSVAGGAITQALIGLLGLPLLIFISVLLIHALFSFYGRSFSVKNCFTLIAIFSLAILIQYRSILGVCAVAFVLTFGEAFHKPIVIKELLSRTKVLAALLSIPVVIVLCLVLFDPHPELVNPHRGLEDYFFKSSRVNEIWGAVSFYPQKSARLFSDAMALPPVLGEYARASWVTIVLGILFVLGLVSFKGNRVFPLVLFFLVGSLSHIVLNLMSFVPYGNLRYFMPFFIAYPVLTSVGVSKVLNFIGSFPILKRYSFSKVVDLIFVTLILIILFQLYTATSQRNSIVNEGFENGFVAVESALSEKGAGLVLDIWTANSLSKDKRYLLDEHPFVFKSSIKTLNKKIPVEKLENFNEWKKFIKNKKSIVAMTSIPFREKYFGNLFKVANDQFEITYLKRVPIYNFTIFTLRQNPQVLSSSDLDQSAEQDR